MKTTFFLHLRYSLFLPLSVVCLSMGQAEGVPGHLFIISGGAEPPALMCGFVNQSGGADSRMGYRQQSKKINIFSQLLRSPLSAAIAKRLGK